MEAHSSLPTSSISRQQHRSLLLLSLVALCLLVYRGYGNRLHLRPTSPLPAPEWSGIDLNRADRAELLQLPGVGPALADAILHQRQSQGGFRTVSDLQAVRGIGNKTLERLRDHVQVEPSTHAVASPTEPVERLERPQPSPMASPPTPRTPDKLAPGEDRIDINFASMEELQRLPGIGVKLAERIVSERKKQPFSSVEELRRVSGIGVKTLEKLRPLVTCR